RRIPRVPGRLRRAIRAADPRQSLRRARGRARLRRSASVLVTLPGFDLDWYRGLLGREVDLPAAVDHYLRTGRAAGWVPPPLFDPAYHVRSGGAAGSSVEAFAAYLSGQGRRLPTHPLLDIAQYLAVAPEAESFPGGPVEHYRLVGAGRGLPPNAWFDPA